MADFYFGSTTPNTGGNFEVYGPTGSRPEIIGNVQAPYVLVVPAGGITITELERGLNENTAGGTVWVGVYDAADDSLIVSGNITITGGGPDNYIWHNLSGLSTFVAEGTTIYAVSAQPTVDVFGTADTVANGVSETAAASQTLPDPFNGSAFTLAPPIRVGYSLGGGITVTQADDTPEDGVQQSFTTTGLSDPMTAASLGGKDILSILSDTDPTTATTYTLDISATEASEGQPRIGETSTLSVTAVEGTATTDVIIQPKTGWAVVTLAGTLNKDANGFLATLDSTLGVVSAVGDIIYYDASNNASITAQGVYTSDLTSPGEFTEFVIQQGGSATTVATSEGGAFYPYGQADAPDQFDLGPDVVNAEPNAVVDRSFVVAGLDAPQTFTATGSGLVSLTAGSGFGASVEADTGDTIYFRLVADSAFNTLVSGGVTCNGVSDSVDVTTRAQEAPVLPATLTLFGAVDQPFFTVLNAYLSDGDLPTAWAKVGGADEAQYTLNNDSTFSRDVDQDTEESEVVDVQASNAAGSSGTMVVTIQYTEQAAGSDTLLVARTLRARTL